MCVCMCVLEMLHLKLLVVLLILTRQPQFCLVIWCVYVEDIAIETWILNDGS